MIWKPIAALLICLFLGATAHAQLLPMGVGLGSNGGCSGVCLFLSGPSTGLIGVASTTFTVTIVNATFNGTATVVLSDGTNAGTFAATAPGGTITSCTAGSGACTVAPANTTTSFTFTYTAAGSAGTRPISMTNTGGYTNPPSLSYTVTPPITGYTITGPGSGTTGVPSTNFTTTLTPAGAVFAGGQTIVLHSTDPGSTFTTAVPTSSCAPGSGACTVMPGSGTSFTFTYTASINTNATLSFTNPQGWTNQTNLSYSTIITPTGMTLTGPSGGAPSTASTNFTVTINPTGAVFNGTTTVTLTDSGGGGTFTTPGLGSPGDPVTVTPPSSSTNFIFTYTPNATVTTRNITVSSASPVLPVTPTPPWPYNVSTGASLALSGPPTGPVGIASSNFTVTLTGDTFNAVKTVTVADGGQSGTFVMTSAGTTTSCTAGSGTCTFIPTSGTTFTYTYQPANAVTVTMTTTNGQGWGNGSTTYNAMATLTLSGPTTGTVGSPSTNFTVALAGLSGFTSGQTAILNDGQTGTNRGSFAGGCVGLGTCTATPGSGSSFTFTYNAALANTAIPIALTNGQGWVNLGTPVNYTANALLTFSGPSSGAAGVLSTPFTVTVQGTNFTGTAGTNVTIDDGLSSNRGTLSSCAANTGHCVYNGGVGNQSFNFQYTPNTTSPPPSVTLTMTNAAGWVESPSFLVYTITGGASCTTGALDWSQPTGCNLVWAGH